MKNDHKGSTLDDHNEDSQFQQSNYSAALLAEQIRLLYQQAVSALLGTLCIAMALVLVFWNYAPKSWLLGWLTTVCLLTSIRFLLVRSYFRENPPVAESTAWGRLFVLSVFLSGVTWGTAGGIFFVESSAVHQLFLAFLLGGMVAGAMSTLSSYKHAFLVFAIPAAFPYLYQVITYESDTYIATACTYLLFIILLSKISHQLHYTITDSLKFRFDNFELLNRLLRAKDYLNAMNQALHTQIAEKDLTQQALQDAKEKLEQRVAERTEALALSNKILHQEKELFQITLASIGDAVITTDSLGKITYLNPIAELFTGWLNNDANGASLQNIFRIKDVTTQVLIENPLTECLNKSGRNHECLLVQKNKQECIIDYSVAPILDHKKDVIGAVLTFRDVTEQRKLTQKLAYQAAHDSLTGLLNRDEFENRLNKILTSTRKYDIHALLYLDLDQFKVINDTCGHTAGDELLRQVTALLHSKLRTRDTLARLGGDEFGIILEHCPRNEAIQVANALRELVQNFRFQWQDKTFTIGVSIGLFQITHNNEGLVSALSAADSACFAAKDRGRNRIHIYQSDDNVLQKRSGEMQWLPRLQKAIENQQLCLYFQPIIAISNKNELKEHGEFLLRLQDEQNQLILPGSFLSSVERYDQMLAIDRWVIGESFKLLKAHLQHRSKSMYAINLSSHALGNEDFLDFVVANLKTHISDPSSICFEITENVALADLQHVMKFILTLKKLGCHFSMDDFGSGLSSFGYLKNIPLDYLKIDGRLVKGILSDPVDRAMVESINHIGHIMGLKTIAEWVENAGTLKLLEEIGVDYVQGYELATPYLFRSEPAKHFAGR